MTRDKIDQLAKLANIDLEHHVSIGRDPVWIATPDELAAFAALVAAAERENCAISCEVHAARVINDGKQPAWAIAHECAAAIRARKPA